MSDIPSPGGREREYHQAEMKIVVNNQDRTADMKDRIASGMQAHSRLPPPLETPPELNALALRDAHTEAEYQDTLIRLIRYRDNVDTLPFDIPHRGGWRGRCAVWIKKKLWKLLRYQHDRITCRQNLINSHFSGALEYERDRRRADIERLEAKIAELEKKHSS